MASSASCPRWGWMASGVRRAGTRHVRPGQAPGAAHPRLVVMQHRRVRACILAVPLDRLQSLRRRRHPAHQRAARQPPAQQVGAQVLHPAQGQVLLLDQGDGHGPHARAVRRPAGGCGRQRAHAAVRTSGAAHVQRSMLAHQPAHHGGQLVHLPPFVQHHLGGSTTSASESGVWHWGQWAGRCSTTSSGSATRCTVSPRVAQLPARLLAALLA